MEQAFFLPNSNSGKISSVKKYFAGLGELLVFFTKFYLKVKQLNFHPEIVLRLEKTQDHVVGSPTLGKFRASLTERVILHSLSLLLRVILLAIIRMKTSFARARLLLPKKLLFDCFVLVGFFILALSQAVI
jgi:hypothetical protein